MKTDFRFVFAELIALPLALFLSAPSGCATEDPESRRGLICTAMSCGGDFVEFEFARPLAEGPIRILVEADGERFECHGASGAEDRFECFSEEGDANGAYDPETNILWVWGTPRSVLVTILEGDSRVLSRTFRPTYEDIYPNGILCDYPYSCRQAHLFVRN